LKGTKGFVSLLLLCAVLSLLPGPAFARGDFVFTDPVFEEKVYYALQRNGVIVNEAMCKRVTELNLSNLTLPAEQWDGLADSEKIHSLEDLRYFPNLTSLDFGLNAVEDITPLAQLKQLTYLEAPMNRISDLTPIAGLTSLEHAVFWDNRIEDLGPVAGLTKLKVFSVSSNRISDIGPLAALTGLTTLELSNNPVTDFSPVAAFYDGLEVKDFSLETADGGTQAE